MGLEFGFSLGRQQPVRTLLKVENTSICEVISGKSKNLAYNWLIKSTGTTLKKYLHPCPYSVSTTQSLIQMSELHSIHFQGQISFSEINISEQNTRSSKMPGGDYRIALKFHDKSDENIMKLVIKINTLENEKLDEK